VPYQFCHLVCTLLRCCCCLLQLHLARAVVGTLLLQGLGQLGTFLQQRQ